VVVGTSRLHANSLPSESWDGSKQVYQPICAYLLADVIDVCK